MQPEPTDISPSTSNLPTPQPQSTPSQHGFPLDQPDLRSSDQHDLSREERVERSISPTTRSQSPGEQRGGTAGVQEQWERLSITGLSESKPTVPKYQQIADYENASSPSPPRKDSEGPAFKVIKHKGHSVNGVQLDEFPNGTSSRRDVGC